MLDYYTGVLKNYTGFGGRARRAEFWQFVLVNAIVGTILTVIGTAIGFVYLNYIYDLAILLPGLAVTMRRLHDTGRSGWWTLLFLTVIGSIVIVILAIGEGTRGPNKYGPDPKNPGVDAATAYTTV